MTRIRQTGLVIALGAAAVSLATGQAPQAVDTAFEAFWKADDPRDAERAAERIIKSGVEFDAAWTRLREGRAYKKEKTDEFSLRFSAPQGAVFDNVVDIPADYDPAKRWPMRVQLHGGVNRPGPATGGIGLEDGSGGGRAGGAPALDRRRGPNRIAGDNQIYVYPSGWADASWWHTHQVENILKVIDRVKRKYNVDESLVHLTGISDGGTGAYYIAMKEATPWSAFLPLNGSIKVLGNPAIRADGDMYPSNMVNKPFFIVNGGRDPLYPVSHVQGHIDVYNALGVPLVFKPQPNAGHDTSWWAWERGPFEQFVKTHPRRPHPEKLSWETERTDRHNRVHWLVIERLGQSTTRSTFSEFQILEPKRQSGRVDVSRTGNAIDVKSRYVREITLLLSPDVFDFAQPITVTINDQPTVTHAVKKDLGTLLKWAARDNDRTMLYAAELHLQIP
jgi:poly(3-hydroxybutyrate) depolymerase